MFTLQAQIGNEGISAQDRSRMGGALGGQGGLHLIFEPLLRGGMAE